MTNGGFTGFPSNSTGLSQLDARYGYPQGSLITTGEETCPRLMSSQTLAFGTQSLRLAFFTARKSETVNNIIVYTAGTAAAATPTLCRMGLYVVNSDGSLTLGTACASDTSLFASVNTRYSRALTNSFPKVSGQRYAFGLLVVTATTMPTFYGGGPPFAAWNVTPMISAQVTGQSDLPVAVTFSSLSGSGAFPYGELTP